MTKATKAEKMARAQSAAETALELHWEKLGDMEYDDQDDEPRGPVVLVCAMTMDELFAIVPPQTVGPLPAIAWTMIANAVEQFGLTSQAYELPMDQGYDEIFQRLPGVMTDTMRTAVLAASSGLPSLHAFRLHAERMAKATEGKPAYFLDSFEVMDDE